MNERDEELYEQAEKYADANFKGEGGGAWVEAFESQFANLIRADEREACAKILESISNAPDMASYAAAIRARGNT